MRIYSDHPNLQYSGRIDFSEPKAPVFVYPCTYVRMRFTGTYLKAYVKNHTAYWDNYIGCILDGKQTAYLLEDNGETVLELYEEHPDRTSTQGVHEVLLFKRQDACHELTFCGFELSEGGNVLELDEKPSRRIEVYGDSVSAGEVSEAIAYTGKADPPHQGEYSNSWYSYAWMTARRLHAQIHDIAQGGAALMDQTGFFCEPSAVGMESIWDKIHYHPQLGPVSEWDFNNYIPQVVIVAIGQNDSHPQDYMKKDFHCVQADLWRAHYKAFLGKIRGKYPDAQIVCCMTLLNHDQAWDRSIEQVCRECKDEKITHYTFRRNGAGTPGHLRIPEAEEMAEELAAYIQSLSINGWENETD